jgi:hypothetical protein
MIEALGLGSKRDGYFRSIEPWSVSEMRAFGVVVDESGSETGLECFDAVVEGLAHLHPEELVKHGVIGPLDGGVAPGHAGKVPRMGRQPVPGDKH